MKPNRSVAPLTIVLNRKTLPTNFVVLPYVKRIPGALLALQEQKQCPSEVVAPKNSSVEQSTKSPESSATTIMPKQEPPKSPVKKVTVKKTEIKKQSLSTLKKDIKKETKQLAKIEKPSQKKTIVPSKKTKKVVQKKRPINHQTVPQTEHKPCVANEVLAKNNETKPLGIAQELEREVIYLGRDDFAALVTHEAIQKHIEQVWQPPIGVSKKCSCAIKVVLDNQGGISDLIIEESSNVLPYDIAARAALEQAPFPQEMWGKNIVITFK